MRLAFLSAHWNNLFLASYAVSPALLEPRLPAGLQLDLRDGNAFVSLVAFEFLHTRVLGVPWPGYRNFAELNLRFYVRHGSDRGVVFIREFVPQRLVAWMARAFYNEPYLAAPLTARRQEDESSIRMDYQLTFAGGEHRISVVGDKPGFRPGPDSLEHFFKEHHWGFGRTRGGRCLRYEVEHPVWDVYPVRSFELEFDWGLVYGPEWDFLAGARPISTVLVAGSAVRVFPWGREVSPDRAKTSPN
jgi:uncharacterized protein YqjF (DUF2071 family)